MHDKTIQILKGATSYLTSGVVTTAATFVTSIVVSRYLGKEGLGILSVSLTVVLMGVVFSELGLNPLIVREFATPGRTAVLSLRSILLFRFGASSFISVCVCAVAIVFPGGVDSFSAVWGTCLLIISRSAGSALENFIKAKLQHAVYLFLILSTTIVQILFVYLILNAKFGIGETILTLAATDIIKLLGLMFLARNELLNGRNTSNPTAVKLKPLLAHSAPFMLIGLLTFLGERADILLLATVWNAAEVGLYSAADRFLVLGNLIDSALFASALPILSSLSNRKDHGRITRQVTVGVISISLLVGAVLFFAAPFIIKATFRFTESVVLLQVLSVSFPAMLANRVLRTGLYALRRERLVAMVLAAISLGSLVLNVIFIPRYGAIAAAVVTVVVEYALALMYGGLYMKELRNR